VQIPLALEILDARMADFRADPVLAVHYRNGLWLEGPAYSAADGHLLFSDIPNDRTLRLDERSGQVVEHERPSQFANGRTFDAAGRVVTCRHGDRRVVRRELDGTETVIADSFGGLPLNSPNDVVVDSGGDIWFTDPTYGIASDYEGHLAEQEQPVRGLYRWRESADELELVFGHFDQPNGLAFARDESVLYVVDSGRDTLTETSPADPGRGARLLASGQVFDGIRVDVAGRIWAGTGAGVSCFDADGAELLRIALPERASNLTFGGPQRDVLYITATTSLYSVRTSVSG
jgi:gluconolactonase